MVRGTDSESLILCVSQISCGLCAMYPTTRLSMAEAYWATGVSTSSDYVRVMDQRLCQWLLCQANSYPVR